MANLTQTHTHTHTHTHTEGERERAWCFHETFRFEEEKQDKKKELLIHISKCCSF